MSLALDMCCEKVKELSEIILAQAAENKRLRNRVENLIDREKELAEARAVIELLDDCPYSIVPVTVPKEFLHQMDKLPEKYNKQAVAEMSVTWAKLLKVREYLAKFKGEK